MCSKIDFIHKYFEDDGTECSGCENYIHEPDVNYKDCKILDGYARPDMCPAIPIKFVADETAKETIQELENAKRKNWKNSTRS